ncbi:MAG: hypothetical protein NZ914_09720 [Gemmatales bacterium]|nr:hypothetical protein [Gemmatales bacterium]
MSRQGKCLHITSRSVNCNEEYKILKLEPYKGDYEYIVVPWIRQEPCAAPALAITPDDKYLVLAVAKTYCLDADFFVINAESGKILGKYRIWPLVGSRWGWLPQFD